MKTRLGWTFTDPFTKIYSFGDCPVWAGLVRKANPHHIEGRIRMTGTFSHPCRERGCDMKH